MRFVVATVLLGALSAWADEPVVPVQVEVIRASTKGGEVPPALQKMQIALGARIKYGSMKVFSTKNIELKAAPERVALPNANHAAFSLARLKDGVATVQVEVPPTKATYTLAKNKSLYFQAGSHEGDDLWVVLSQPK